MKNPKIKIQILKFLFSSFTFTFFTLSFSPFLSAQGSSLEQTVDQYYRDHKYNECIEYLDNFAKENKASEATVSYYSALTRYNQLKYLEESQSWNEYFNSGNDYRSQIASSLQKAAGATTAGDQLNVRAKELLWKTYKDQNSDLSDSALTDMLASIQEYAKASGDINLIKEVADALLSYEEKGKAKELYKLYTDKLITAGTKDSELEAEALSFYKAGNLELSEIIYDAYIDRLIKGAKKEIAIPALISIGRQFSYLAGGQGDLAYAEKVFQRLEEIGGKEAFDQGLLYNRACNLEKSKEYTKAKDIYIDLLGRFPQSPNAQRASYKTGIIYAYVLRDLKSAREYFEKLSQKENVSAEVISAIYQLGLLKQWESESVKAKEYYDQLLKKAGDSYPEKVNLAKERIKEIEETKPLEYNLKAFLDLSLKEENKAFEMVRLDLKSEPDQLKENDKLKVTALAITAVSGCMQVQVAYLWSGDLGSANPPKEASSFDTSYKEKGVKVINLAAVLPTGFLDRNIEITDID